MNRRDFIAGAVGGFIVGAGVGYSIGRRKPAQPEPTDTQSGSLTPAAPPSPTGIAPVGRSA